MSVTYENILLIKPSSLGDIVLSLPALSALRRNWPRAHITWLVRPEFAAILEGHPHLDALILFDRKKLGKAWRSVTAFREMISLIQRLRSRRFDAVLDLQALFRTASLAWLSGSRKRFGPILGREMAHVFYTTALEVREEWIHVVDCYVRLVGAMDATDLAVEFVLPEREEAAAAAHDLLARSAVDAKQYAVIIPGSAQANKCWPIERFAALADRITSEHGLAVVATGSPAEREMIERVCRLAKRPIANFAGRTSIPELVEIIRPARLVVCGDTGPGHIAAALGRPMVMMFSWSNPRRVGPYGRPECCVARDPNDRGLAIRSRNPEHRIEQIAFDEVYAKVGQQLSGTDAGSP